MDNCIYKITKNLNTVHTKVERMPVKNTRQNGPLSQLFAMYCMTNEMNKQDDGDNNSKRKNKQCITDRVAILTFANFFFWGEKHSVKAENRSQKFNGFTVHRLIECSEM